MSKHVPNAVAITLYRPIQIHSSTTSLTTRLSKIRLWQIVDIDEAVLTLEINIIDIVEWFLQLIYVTGHSGSSINQFRN